MNKLFHPTFFTLHLALLLMLLLSSSSASAQGFGFQPDANTTGLKDAYKDYFTVGVAVNLRNVSNENEMDIIRKNFNSITAENDMKPVSVHPKEGVWNWGAADSIANFCRENGIPLRGHCLCWHSQFSDWMFTDKKGRPVKKEVFYQRLREHIHTVVNRYKDVVYAWDVVNEAIADNVRSWPGHEGNPYRESRHWQLCGDEFIAKAFEFAHEADPNALLFYNDYNAADPGKRCLSTASVCKAITTSTDRLKRMSMLPSQSIPNWSSTSTSPNSTYVPTKRWADSCASRVARTSPWHPIWLPCRKTSTAASSACSVAMPT